MPPLNCQCQRHGQQQQWPASPGASSQCVWCGMASSAASGAPWPVRVVRYPVHPKQCETEAESVQRRATVASPSSAMQQAPSTPWRRAPRAAPPSRAMVAWARLVQQAMVSSHSARQAPWRRRPSMPAEQRLLKRQKVVSSSECSSSECSSSDCPSSDCSSSDCSSFFSECLHERTFHNLRQCLLCLHAMRISPARSHQSLVYILRPPASPASPRSPSTSPD